jgi:Lrp/AsnC family transcriptional regulator for asnA, asnC and gidA
MPVAYLLVNTEAFDPEILKTLRSIKGVEEAYAVYGVYDLVVRTKADTMAQLRDIHNKIRKLNKVRQTLTMIAHEE